MAIVTPDLAAIWRGIQVCLLPNLQECLDDPLTERLKQFIAILEIVRIEEHVTTPSPPDESPRGRPGRPRQDRGPIARALVAKAVYNLPTTDLLIEMLHLQPNLRRLCGWQRRSQIPSPATFSRAFTEFAHTRLGDALHAALVDKHVGKQLVMHISRDSTEICARERAAAPPPKAEPAPPKKRGRPKKGEVRPPHKTRLHTQMEQSADEAIAELPCRCNKGTKTDSKGHWHFWVGWKAHIDWVDGGLPVNVVTTSASLHDSQVAIPLAKRTAERITSLYDLMDSAYDAKEIKQVSRELGHVPIIDPNRRPANSVPLEPASRVRFRERSVAERGNSRLKDEFGCRNLRVRGHRKAHLHVMFGVLALFADQLLKPLTG
jgi:hypothetical protein